jgi:hypothetical protein
LEIDMKKNLVPLAAVPFLVCAETALAQSILRPTIIGYSNQVPSHPLGRPEWLYLCGLVGNHHPDQFKPDGKNRAQIHSVSPMGDLSHEGGGRWILEVRLTGPYPNVVFNALIATPESVASETNPTWYYVPAEDDPVDRVLLDASVYSPESAMWATQVVGGKIKVGFVGVGPVGGLPTRGLFVGSVTWGGSGPVGPVQDITLVAPGDPNPCTAMFWKWGTANQLVFELTTVSGGSELWIADVSGIPAVPPALVFTGVAFAAAYPHHYPALSRSGLRLAYVTETATGRAIHVRTLATGATYTLPVGNLSSNSIHGVEWSPDDQAIVFSARTPSNPSYSAYKSSTTNQPDKLTSSKVVNGVVVGSMRGSFAWRR